MNEGYNTMRKNGERSLPPLSRSSRSPWAQSSVMLAALWSSHGLTLEQKIEKIRPVAKYCEKRLTQYPSRPQKASFYNSKAHVFKDT